LEIIVSENDVSKVTMVVGDVQIQILNADKLRAADEANLNLNYLIRLIFIKKLTSFFLEFYLELNFSYLPCTFFEAE
jgi:hypothetical protein